MYSLRRPRRAALAALRQDQADRSLTYAAVGASLAEVAAAPDVLEGYDVSEASGEVGRGNTAMLQARRAIRGWAGHAEAGIVLEPEVPPLEEGLVLALAAPMFGMWVTAACRIVRVVDTDDRFGFAYGTLPHHPETGEECFLAERAADGTIRITVRVFSNPATRLARAGGPVSMRVRDRVLRRYVTGLVGTAAGGLA